MSKIGKARSRSARRNILRENAKHLQTKDKNRYNRNDYDKPQTGDTMQ